MKKAPPTIKNFNEVIRANAEIISHKSKLMHSLNNIAECGETAESYMRDLIAEILPSHFRVTSGYVVYIREKGAEPKFSHQLDIIIVDTRISNIFYPQPFFKGKSEFIIQEAVVGIFEVKRALTKSCVLETLEKMKIMLTNMELEKNQGGVGNSINSGGNCNPLLGIIALHHDIKKDTSFLHTEEFQNSCRLTDGQHIRLIFSLDGFIQFLTQKGQNSPHLDFKLDHCEYRLIFPSEYSGLRGLNYIAQYIQNAHHRGYKGNVLEKYASLMD